MDLENKVAIYVLDQRGLIIAEKISSIFPSHIFLKKGNNKYFDGAILYDSLKDIVRENFKKYRYHIFICALGIAVRVIAPFVESKDKDPAVIVIDIKGKFVISVLSGHLGGANQLARNIAKEIGAIDVITTATDVLGLPAIDEIARILDMEIDDIKKIKRINSAIIHKKPIWIYDPFNFLNVSKFFPDQYPLNLIKKIEDIPDCKECVICHYQNIYVDDYKLFLYPKVLYVGVGCNSNTDFNEIYGLLKEVFKKNRLNIQSIKAIVTTEKKKYEKGIIDLARFLKRELIFIKHELLDQVIVPNPSSKVKKHMGVFSVCEAAAMIASKGKIIVEKTKTKNVTIAVAIKL